mmetsp:Transcript_43550/g.132547  ORF Transcript_43550/g.132547 Transcript_43550/m.132547 type:complete len:205 (+) Transcript_43550:1372-1986(+)
MDRSAHSGQSVHLPDRIDDGHTVPGKSQRQGFHRDPHPQDHRRSVRGRSRRLHPRLLRQARVPRHESSASQADGRRVLGIRARVRMRTGLSGREFQHPSTPVRIHRVRSGDGHPRALRRGTQRVLRSVHLHLRRYQRTLLERIGENPGAASLRGSQVPPADAQDYVRGGVQAPARRGGRSGRSGRFEHGEREEIGRHCQGEVWD